MASQQNPDVSLSFVFEYAFNLMLFSSTGDPVRLNIVLFFLRLTRRLGHWPRHAQFRGVALCCRLVKTWNVVTWIDGIWT